MRKLFSLIAAVLFTGSMMAADVVFSGEDFTGGSAHPGSEFSITKSGVTVTANRALGTGSELRVFASDDANGTSTLTVAAGTATITSIVGEFTAQTKMTFDPQEPNASDWTIEATKQIRLSKLTVTISGGTPATPAEQLQQYINDLTTLKGFVEQFVGIVEGADQLVQQAEQLIALGNLALLSGDEATIQSAVSQAEAKVEEVINIALSKGKEGLKAQLDQLLTGVGECDECPALVAAAKELIDAIAWDPSKSVSQNVEAIMQKANAIIEKTQKQIDAILNPGETISCAEVYDLAKGDNVALNPVTVTFANGKNVWVRDESASMLIYLSANTQWSAGDVLTGVEGVVDIYNGVYEVKPSADQAAAVSAVAGDQPDPEPVEAVTTADMNRYIFLSNIAVEGTFTTSSISNITINVAGEDIVLRNNFKRAYTFAAGKNYDIVGVVTIYSSKPQIYFIDAQESGSTPLEVVYYLVGSLNGWEPSEAFEFAANPAADGEFMLNTTLAEGDEIKVKGVHLNDNQIEWFPDNADNYVVDAAHAGDVTVYFRPDGQGGDDWYYGFFYIQAPEPQTLLTCREVYSKAKDDAVALNPVVVTYVNGKNVWVRDASGAMLLYLSANATWEAGDILTGVEGVVDIYKSLYEVKPSADQVAAVAVEHGEAPDPFEPVSLDDVNNGIMNEYIILKGIALEGEFTSESSTSINLSEALVLFNKFKYEFTFEAGKTYDILGVVSIYNSNLQVNFISAEESGVAPAPEVVYYLVGSLNGWETSEAFEFAANPAADGEFMLNTTLAEGDEIKVKGVHLNDNQEEWFPTGMGNNYVVDADHAGDVTVYFRPDGQGGDDWYYGFFYIQAPEPLTPISCAEVYALSKNDEVALNDVTVTYVNGKNVWVKDASGAMLLYLSANAEWEAGDVLSNVCGIVDVYKGLHEVKPSADQVAAIVAQAGEKPDPEELLAIDESADINKYVVFHDVELSGSEFESNKLTMTVGENSYELFNKFGAEILFDTSKKYAIVGIVSIYNNLQVLFIDATEEGSTPVEPLTFQFAEDEEGITVIPSDDEQAWDYAIMTVEEFEQYHESDPDALAANWFEMFGFKGKSGIRIFGISDLDNGEYVLVVWAEDEDGVTSAAATYEFTISKEPADINYYLVGTFNDWGWDAELQESNLSTLYQFQLNEGAQGEEYMMAVDLEAGDELKVVGVPRGFEEDRSEWLWFPGSDQSGDHNYVVDADHAGIGAMYFRPEGLEAWQEFHYGGFFYIQPIEMIEVAVSGLTFNDNTANSYPWWSLIGEDENYKVRISSYKTTEIEGIYEVGSEEGLFIDPGSNFTYLIDKSNPDVLITFTAGYASVEYGTLGNVIIDAYLVGSDGANYHLYLSQTAPHQPGDVVVIETNEASWYDECETDGWWVAEAQTETHYITLSNYDLVSAAPGTYTAADLDPDYSYVIFLPYSDTKIQFTDGSVTVSVAEDGPVTTITVAGTLIGEDGVTYIVNLVKKLVDMTFEFEENVADGIITVTPSLLDEKWDYVIVDAATLEEYTPDEIAEIIFNNYGGDGAEAGVRGIYLDEENLDEGDYVLVVWGVNGGVSTAAAVYEFTYELPIHYYLIGSFSEWKVNDANVFALNEEAEDEEYMLYFTLEKGQELKVVGVPRGSKEISDNWIWFPSGMDNNYKVDESRAGFVTVYFRPEGNTEWEAFHEGGFFYITESVVPERIEITITSGLSWVDACASQGWWQIYGYYDDDTKYISLSNIGEHSVAAGTYDVATEMDATWSCIKDRTTGEVIATFISGTVTVDVKDNGNVVVDANVMGDDGNTYIIHLEYGDPTPEVEVTVVITGATIYDGYSAYGLWGVYGYAEDGTYVQLGIWAGEELLGEFTEADLDNTNIGSGIIDASGTQNIFSATIVITNYRRGSIKIEADLLCYNNTLYHVTMITPETWAEGIDETLSGDKVEKILRDGQIFIIKGDKTFNMQGILVK